MSNDQTGIGETRTRPTGLRLVAAVLTLVAVLAGTGGAQSLEEQTRRPPGTNSLEDDSERVRGDDSPPPSDTLDNDSMNLRGHTADQDGTNSLDDGSMQGGNGPDDD